MAILWKDGESFKSRLFDCFSDALLICIGNKLSHVVRLTSIEYRANILAVVLGLLTSKLREVHPNGIVLLDDLNKSRGLEFFEGGHVDGNDVSHIENFFAAGDDIEEEL